MSAFVGSGGHQPVPSARWSSSLDNADDTLPSCPRGLRLMRRLHRGGEGQYHDQRHLGFVVRTWSSCSPVGLGGRRLGHSQGKASRSSRPSEERRALVEEAAGFGKFTAAEDRAALKLARVAQDVARGGTSRPR